VMSVVNHRPSFVDGIRVPDVETGELWHTHSVSPTKTLVRRAHMPQMGYSRWGTLTRQPAASAPSLPRCTGTVPATSALTTARAPIYISALRSAARSAIGFAYTHCAASSTPQGSGSFKGAPEQLGHLLSLVFQNWTQHSKFLCKTPLPQTPCRGGSTG
jgi:hypothetical protein